MEYVTPEYDQQLLELAESLVTPARYAAQLAISNEIPIENLRFDD